MTLDLIADARRRTRRTVATLLAVACGALVVSCVAGRYAATDLPAIASSDPSTVDLVEPGGSPTGPRRGTAALPADVVWVRVAGVQLPVSVTAGPAEMADELASGFTHSIAGAVGAGLHLLVRTTAQVGPDVFDPTIAGQVVGDDSVLFRQSVTAQYTAAAARLGVPYGEPLGDLPASVAGVRIETTERGRVGLGVLTAAPDRTGTTRYAATAVLVLWVDGDWRLVAPPGGSWDELVHVVDASAIADYPPIGRG